MYKIDASPHTTPLVEPSWPLYLNIKVQSPQMEFKHGSSPSPSYFRGDIKISDQNDWGRPEQKIKFGGS